MPTIMMDYLLPDVPETDLKLPVGARFRTVIYIKGLDKITLVMEEERIPAEWYTQTLYVCKSNTELPTAAVYIGSCYVEYPTSFVVRHVFAKKTPAQMENDEKLITAMERLTGFPQDLTKPIERLMSFSQEVAAEREARKNSRLRRLFGRGNTDAQK